jgi:DNA repair photolyase
VLIAPILPGITDSPEQLREVVKGCIEAGATHASPILLHLRPGIREEYMPWLAEHYPDLLPRYESMYTARSGYASKAHQRELGDRVHEIVRESGGFRPPPAALAARFRRGENGRRPETKPPEQLSLL